MARSTNADLLRRIEELESENATLRVQVLPVSAASERPVRVQHRRNWSWTLLATVLVVIGAVLAPVAVVASWAKIELTDTTRFVAAYAPLAKDPAVQAFITDEALDVINQQVDVPKLTSDVFDGIAELGTGPVATRALEALKGPAAQGIQSLMRTGVQGFVGSPAFADVWAEALRISHSQLVSALQSDPGSAISLGDDGSIGIQLAPIIEAVKQHLVAQGITFASQIPAVDRTITVAQSDAIPTVQLAYGLALAAGAWLPWVSLLFLAAGVLVARRRALALVWAAIGLAVAMAALLVGFGVGKIVLVSSISPSLVPANVARILFETVVQAMRDTGVSVLVLAVVVAVVAWYSGPFRIPRRLRGFFASGVRWIRESAEQHGVTTGATGVWLYRQRVLLRVVVAVGSAAIVLLVRPLTAGLVVWTLVVAAIVIALLELLQRPVVEVPEGADEGTPVVTVG